MSLITRNHKNCDKLRKKTGEFIWQTRILTICIDNTGNNTNRHTNDKYTQNYVIVTNLVSSKRTKYKLYFKGQSTIMLHRLHLNCENNYVPRYSWSKNKLIFIIQTNSVIRALINRPNKKIKINFSLSVVFMLSRKRWKVKIL